MDKRLLDIENLKTYFYTDEDVIPAVDGVSFSVNKGETIGVVGESGSGKSVTALSIMQLTPGKAVEGNITFDNKDMLSLSEKKMRKIRGKDIAMIFQEPLTSLNPLFTIGEQISEVARIHLGYNKKQGRKKAIEMMNKVGIPEAERIVDNHPHQLSGGMRQRIMIAIAMTCDPKLLIADEPTTALDVTIQAQILDLMKSLKQNNDTAVLMITHDLGVVAEVCDRVVVMYAGKVVEQADVFSLFENPKHPYTKGLIESMPTLESKETRLPSIRGNIPSPETIKKGCPFASRCDFVMDICKEKMPPEIEIKENHFTKCYLYTSIDKEGDTNVSKNISRN